MGVRNWTAIVGLLAVLLTSADAAEPGADDGISWKKTTIEGTFRSEGVATADVNKDGTLDILIGDSWYEAPSLDQARHPQARRLRRRPALLQRLHDLLG